MNGADRVEDILELDEIDLIDVPAFGGVFADSGGNDGLLSLLRLFSFCAASASTLETTSGGFDVVVVVVGGVAGLFRRFCTMV